MNSRANSLNLHFPSTMFFLLNDKYKVNFREDIVTKQISKVDKIWYSLLFSYFLNGLRKAVEKRKSTQAAQKKCKIALNQILGFLKN